MPLIWQDPGENNGRPGAHYKVTQSHSYILGTSFFARGQRAFKLVLSLSLSRRRKGKEEERGREREKGRKKEKCEKENIKADEKRGSSNANGKIAARVRARGRVDERDRG